MSSEGQVGAPSSMLSVWVQAVRPRTLGAAVGPVLIGTSLAAWVSTWSPAVLVVALVCSLLLQVGTNLANDLFDFQKGADTPDRLGPARATTQGWVTPTQMAAATAATFAAAVACGVWFVVIGGWPIVAIGVASVIAGLAYTGGPYPLGYHGLGDVTVFVFFGPVAVCGTYFMHTSEWSLLSLVVSVPIGALIAAILIVNNVRDRETDARVGKRTLAVRLGRRASLVQYTATLVTAPAVVVALVVGGHLPSGALLALGAVVPGVFTTRSMWRRDGAALNPLLGGTARLGLIFALLFSVGLHL